MSRHYSLKPRKFAMELRTSESCSVHGGQLAIVGLLRQSGLVNWISDYPQLDHRKNSNRGFDPEVYICTLLYNFCTEGSSLADAEALNEDKALLKLLGIKKLPDQSALERMAEGLPEENWGEPRLEHWRGGTRHLVSYSWVRHQPSGCREAHNFAALRHKREGDMFWSYCFIEVEEGRWFTSAVNA
ncbi:MAG: hypothetical protein H7A51_04245 [Akkermansiaceae bacterium]|nr:hypothetical protein [Akkermansiaceae bacterium]